MGAIDSSASLKRELLFGVEQTRPFPTRSAHP